MYNNGNSSKNVTGASVVDGTLYTVDIADDAVTADKLANTVNTDIATGVSASTTAGDALPKTGGAMTGAITTNSTFDGVDVATRNGVLTTTTNTANAALPKAGGTMTGGLLGGEGLIIDKTNNGYSGTRIHDDSADDYNSYIDLGRDQGATRLTIRRGGRVQGTTPWTNATASPIVSFANSGIAFGADTAAANTLDDYEEGSYTVGFYDAASGGNTSSTTPTGYYTKIGNQVNVTFSASNINTGGLTSGNSAYISLPFTASSFTWGTGTLITDNVNFRSRDTLNAYVGNSATRCYIKASGQATSDAGIRWSEFVSGSSDIVSFSVTYTAA